jgi:DNA-binding beta-propeller fold protein YncE
MIKAFMRGRRSALLLLAAAAAPAQQYVISTVAGGAPPANVASAAGISIGHPNRVTVDSSGNVYFSSLNCVFKLSTNGSLAVVAGNSRAGFSGDGGPAVNAQLNSPQGLAVDSSGNIYIADAGNNRVRIVAPSGIISTFAGNGLPGSYGSVGDWSPAPQANLHLPSGVAVDPSGNVYIADTRNHSLRLVKASGPSAGLMQTIAGDTYAG